MISTREGLTATLVIVIAALVVAAAAGSSAGTEVYPSKPANLEIIAGLWSPEQTARPYKAPESPEPLPMVSDTTPTTAPPTEARVGAVIKTAGWRPADECSRIRNPGPVYLTPATMRWCPKVAEYLSAFTWQPGDLHRLLLIVECESNGDPNAVNPSSGTTGLFQHRPRYFYDRAAQAGVSNPDPFMPYDNIKVGVWLFKTGGRGHWETCGGNWGGPVARTLTNMGY